MQTELDEPGLRPSHTGPNATATAALVAGSRGNVTPLTDVDSASRTVSPSGGVNDSIIRAYLDLETALVEGLSDPAPEAPDLTIDTDLETALVEGLSEGVGAGK